MSERGHIFVTFVRNLGTTIYHITYQQVAIASWSVLRVFNSSEATNLPTSAVTARASAGIEHIDMGGLD